MEHSPSSSGSFTPPSDGDLPARIGGYRVVRRLATGGTSDVLLARAEGPHGFERVVVLKLLLQEFRDDETFERMFAREAAAYARLSHPAIVKLYDFFSDAGQLVMVLEYVDGLPLHKLRALLKGRGAALDDKAAMCVASRIFGALSAAHAARDPQTGEFSPVIHRDVNPSNVLIPWDGHVKIADFGIAKVAGVDMDKTQAGFIKGTYGYMAPEQVRGDPVTVRTDVYAACLLLWELLAGRKAIVRGAMSDLEVLRAMAEPSFPSLAALRPDLPRALLDAIARGLDPDPDRRTVQAEDLGNLLRTATHLDEGRQHLVDALAGVRPPTIPEDLATTTSRPPVIHPTDTSADATIPNPVTLRGLSEVLEGLPPERPRTPLPPKPVPPPAPLPPPAVPPPPAPTPPPPVTRPAAPPYGTTQRLTNAMPPRPAAVPPSVATTTLMGLSSSPSGAPPSGPPITAPMRTVPLPATPRAPATPPPPAANTATPPPVAPGRAPPPAPLPLAATVVLAASAARPPSVPPPPARGSRPPASPFAPPVAAALSPPLFSPPSPFVGPAAFPAPTPPPGPVAWTPGPPLDVEPPRRSRAGAVVAVVLGVAACAAVAVVLWARGQGTAYTPPHDKPLATVAVTGPGPGPATASAPVPASVSAPAPAPTPAPTPAPAPAPTPAPTPAPATAPAPAPATASAAPSGTSGTITVPPDRGGHRVWVDKQIVGESPGTFTVRCGWRAVRVGSQGQLRNLEVPCGGDVTAR